MARQSIIPFTSSLYFDGVNDYISGLTNTARTAGQPIAWFARIKALNTGTCIVGSRNGSGAGQLSKIGISATGLLSFDHDTTGAGGTVSGVSDIRNRWVSVVGVYNGATLRVYVNGTLENTLARANCVLSSTTMAIGRRADTSAEYFKGYMNSVATSYDTITDSDVLYWHTTNILPAGKTLHKEYQLSEGSGTTATDTSGNGNNGTINNGAIWYTTDMYSRARTAASNRRVIQDMKASLRFLGGTDMVTIPANANLNTDSFSIGLWVKPSKTLVQGIVLKNTSVNCWRLFISSTTGLLEFDAILDTYNLTSTRPLALNKWTHIGITYDKPTTTAKMYLNGVLHVSSTSFNNAANDLNQPIYLSPSASSRWNGWLSRFVMFNRALTASEMLQVALTSAPIPIAPVAEHKLEEGAGSVTYDTSGNGNNGTISGAVYSADVPSRKRKLVGGNLIYNGDLEYAPPTNTITNSGTTNWIDGSAAGSTTNALFGWYYFGQVGTGGCKFDNTEYYSGTKSLKISTLTVGSQTQVSTSAGNYASISLNPIPVLPTTSYTYSFMMKTVANSGAANTGAQIQFKERNASGSNIATTSSIGVPTTTGWTRYTGTFTTNSAARFMTPQPTVVGNDGIATLIMDAWIDDLTLEKN